MKKLLNTVAFLCLTLCLAMNASASSVNNTNPNTDNITVVNEASVSLMLNAEDNMYFNSIYYCTEVQKVCLNAKATIQFVQVLDINNEIVLALPIETSIMHLSMEELAVGDYTVNILLEGANEIVSTNVTKK